MVQTRPSRVKEGRRVEQGRRQGITIVDTSVTDTSLEDQVFQLSAPRPSTSATTAPPPTTVWLEKQVENLGKQEVEQEVKQVVEKEVKQELEQVVEQEMKQEVEQDEDTPEVPVAEPLSLHSGVEEQGEEEQARRKQEIQEWVEGRRLLLPQPVKVHEAVPSVKEQENEEDLDLIDQIFDDPVFAASQVNEVKRKVNVEVPSISKAEEQKQKVVEQKVEEIKVDDQKVDEQKVDEQKVDEHKVSEQKEVEEQKVEEQKVEQHKVEEPNVEKVRSQEVVKVNLAAVRNTVWRNIETKFENLPPIYR